MTDQNHTSEMAVQVVAALYKAGLLQFSDIVAIQKAIRIAADIIGAPSTTDDIDEVFTGAYTALLDVAASVALDELDKQGIVDETLRDSVVLITLDNVTEAISDGVGPFDTMLPAVIDATEAAAIVAISESAEATAKLAIRAQKANGVSISDNQF